MHRVLRLELLLGSCDTAKFRLEGSVDGCLLAPVGAQRLVASTAVMLLLKMVQIKRTDRRDCTVWTPQPNTKLILLKVPAVSISLATTGGGVGVWRKCLIDDMGAEKTFISPCVALITRDTVDRPRAFHRRHESRFSEEFQCLGNYT